MASNTAMSSRPVPLSDIDIEFQEAVNRFVSVTDCVFSISGSIHIPESDPLILFFRTSSGMSHSLAFPLKTDILHQLPAFNVLLAACETAKDASFDAVPFPITENTNHESPLVWPSTLPFTTTFELVNQPVLDTIRSVLFPNCHPGAYLTAKRDKLQIVFAGARSESRMSSSSRGLDGEKPVATIVVTLPVRFRGGALCVNSPEGGVCVDTSAQQQGSSGDALLNWTAFLSNCEHEIEFVEQGCRVSIYYEVYMQTLGPIGMESNPRLTPNDELLDALSQLLTISRGRTLGMYLKGRYNCSPADVPADSIVPELKGSDAVLYHALRLYRLIPELRWAAADYVWPADKTVQLGAEVDHDFAHSPFRWDISYPYGVCNSSLQHRWASRQRGASRGVASADENLSNAEGMISMTGIGAHGRRSGPVIYSSGGGEDLQDRVIEGGAISLQEADILMLTERDQNISQVKVPFASAGTMDTVYINILLVTYVP